MCWKMSVANAHQICNACVIQSQLCKYGNTQFALIKKTMMELGSQNELCHCSVSFQDGQLATQTFVFVNS